MIMSVLMPLLCGEGEWAMDAVVLIMTALAADAALGVKDTASSAVKDAYDSLRTLVKKRFAHRPDGELVLGRFEQAPDTWEARWPPN